METLLSVMIYLSVISAEEQYTVDQIQNLEEQNAARIEDVYTDEDLLENVDESYDVNPDEVIVDDEAIAY